MCPPPQVASVEQKPRFLLDAALGRAGARIQRFD
jgi:hypothetical protein